MHHLDSNGQSARQEQSRNGECPRPVSSGPLRSRWGVILAGGDGTRLQPLTRLTCGDDRPKQFCPLLGGKTLLEQTHERVTGTIDPDHILFALTKKHEPFYTQELKHIPRIQQIIQPYNHGTLPAILWSLLRLFHADEHALVAFFPSDHFFVQEDAFISTMERALDFADGERHSVVLLGANADRPETEYGWIEPESVQESESGHSFAPVRRFWEKPSLLVARQLLGQGCLWNTFVMVGSAQAFLEMIQNTSPAIFDAFNRVLSSADPGSEEQAMRAVYDAIAPTDFSKDVLSLSTERLRVTTCGDVGWSDLGEPRRFISAMTENGTDNTQEVTSGCDKCGLTREQIATLSHSAVAAPTINEGASPSALIAQHG